jgi:hypothetical protein
MVIFSVIILDYTPLAGPFFRYIAATRSRATSEPGGSVTRSLNDLMKAKSLARLRTCLLASGTPISHT